MGPAEMAELEAGQPAAEEEDGEDGGDERAAGLIDANLPPDFAEGEEEEMEALEALEDLESTILPSYPPSSYPLP
jgi:hypothetical protein